MELLLPKKKGPDKDFPSIIFNSFTLYTNRKTVPLGKNDEYQKAEGNEVNLKNN